MIKNKLSDFHLREPKLRGIYRGIVENNNDPMMLGRLKIRIHGVHTQNKTKQDIDGIPTDEIPWAEPATSITEGGVSGFGVWSVPLQGSHVFVFFESGNILRPRYFASVPGLPKTSPNPKEGFNDPDGKYPIDSTSYHSPNGLGESDFHRLARGVSAGTIVDYKNNNVHTDIKKAQTGTWDEPNSAFDATYPHNIVFSTHSGITVEYDSTPNKERIHEYHPSKTYREIDKEGNLVSRNAKNKYELVDKDKNSYIVEDYSRTIDRNRESYVGKNEYEKIKKNRKCEIGKNDKEKVRGKRNIKVIGTSRLKASKIYLN